MSTATLTYQCPNCNGPLQFSAEKQLFYCDFCLAELEEEKVLAANTDDMRREEESKNAAYNEAMNEYECEACGARIVTEAHTVATHCYYCDNPILLVGRMSGQMRPNRIIPFKFDKEQAKQRFLSFAKKKWFVPNAFFAKAHVEKIAGVYYPFWVTDADAVGELEADATRLRVWRLGNTEYTETSRFEIHRKGDLHFEDITTSAFSEADKRMLEGILPYPSEALQEFSMPYLSGFQAKKRDVEREALSEEVRRRMQDYTTTLLRNTARGYSSVTPRETNLKIQKSHWEYALMPIWILNYRDRAGQIYTYAMNGHTGKVYGELPVSIPKLGVLLAAVALPLTAFLTWLGGMLF